MKQAQLRNLVRLPTDFKSIVGVGGQTTPVQAMAIIPVTINRLVLPFIFYIFDDLHRDLIIGMDFLHAHEVDIFVSQQKISVKSGITESDLTPEPAVISTARVSAPVNIPAQSEAIVSLVVPSAICQNDTLFLDPHPTPATRTMLVGSRGIANVREGRTQFKVRNATSTSIRLTKRQPIAAVEELRSDSVDIAPIKEPQYVSMTDQLPSDNNNLDKYAKIAKDMGVTIDNTALTGEQRLRLLATIGSNRQAVATDLSELDTTQLHEHITQTNDSPPIKQRFYRTSQPVKNKIERQCELMEQNDVIEPAPMSQVQSPVIMVKKKNGEFRFAVDYRRLNSVTVPNSFPLPRIEDIFDCLGDAGARFFSVVDLCSGFWQIPVAPESQEKTAFVTHHGVWSSSSKSLLYVTFRHKRSFK